MFLRLQKKWEGSGMECSIQTEAEHEGGLEKKKGRRKRRIMRNTGIQGLLLYTVQMRCQTNPKGRN